MEKGLLIKVLGKEDSVKLEDGIYNLRDITYQIRSGLMGNTGIFNEDFIKGAISELEEINKVIRDIKCNVEDPKSIGYTNSREYLKKYLGNIDTNIIQLIINLKPFNERGVTTHNNLLCDSVLKY